jgi:hypothetical protein
MCVLVVGHVCHQMCVQHAQADMLAHNARSLYVMDTLQITQ